MGMGDRAIDVDVDEYGIDPGAPRACASLQAGVALGPLIDLVHIDNTELYPAISWM